MSTATISPRSALDIHRQRHPCSPPSTPVPFDGPSEATPTLPLTSIRIPSLSNIAEERSPRTTGSSLIKSLDGKHSDVELNPEKPAHRRSLLIPGFRNQPPFMVWLRHSWLDVLTQLLCLLVAEMIYLFARPLMPRYFPLFPGVWTSPWGLAHGKPYLGEYINTKISAAVSFVVPFAVMGAMGLWWVRDFWESNAAIMGLGYALVTATIFQSFIKWFVGGLRPHFLSVCLPVIPPPLPGLGAPGNAI